MSKIMEFLKNDHIQVALMTGASIIIMSIVLKKIMHLEVSSLESGIPALIFFGFIIMAGKLGKMSKSFWSRPLFWNLMILAATAVIIILRII